MSDPVTSFAVVSSAANMMGSLISKSEEEAQLEAQRKSALYNAEMLEQEAQKAYFEESMKVGSQLKKGRASIATGAGSMSARGNIGTSAQSQIFGSSKNLDMDVAAIQYYYDNLAITKKNEAAVQRYNAEQLKTNKTGKFLGTLLNGISSGIKSYTMFNELGLGNRNSDGTYWS